MKNHLSPVACAAVLLALVPPSFADELKVPEGVWSVNKEAGQGRRYTQTLQLARDKFTLEIKGVDAEVRFRAEGSVKAEKLGEFQVMRFTNIRAGRGAADLEATTEERAVIYQLDGDELRLAVNLDGLRDQKPTLDVFARQAPVAKTLRVEKVVMHATPQSATWFFCFEAKTDGPMKRFNEPGREYSRSDVTIPMTLELGNIQAGQVCTIKCQLDDVENDVCTDEIDNTMTATFTTSDRGSKEFKPESGWRFTVYWSLK